MKRITLLVAVLVLAGLSPMWAQDASKTTNTGDSAVTSTTTEANFDGQFKCDTCRKHPKDGHCQKCGKLVWGCRNCGEACIKQEPCAKCGKQYERIQEDDAPSN